MLAQATAAPGSILTDQQVHDTLAAAFTGRYTDRRVLVLIPDATRTVPLPQLFRHLTRILRDARQLTFMSALGTHTPLTDEELLRLVGADELPHDVRLTNHAWYEDGTLTSIGTLTRSRIQEIAGSTWHETLGGDVDVLINRAVLEHDEILILGPTFPHEVVGFSGGAKYLFPGISGQDMINVTHWLGALSGVRGTIGIKDTPVRAMIHAAARLVPTPVTLAALIVEKGELSGMFIGDHEEAWSRAADMSSERHIIWVDRPFHSILSVAPPMYSDLWTAGKAMYKLEPALAEGGELIIHAPHLQEVSRVHGQHIRKIGYHVLPYFLAQWERFRDVPLGILAHSTHVRGDGRFEDGVEYPRARVTLSTQLSRAEADEIALGWRDPAQTHAEDFMNREDEGVLYVPKAGEILYRLREP